jgi:ABC-type Fe3+ transport system substrate-binding protein
MLGVVPAVFLVDHHQLGDAEQAPRSWRDLLTDRFAGRIALPVGDFDLFNGILLTLWKHFGDDAITALGRSLKQSLHPSQTTGRFAPGKGRGPAVSVIPYFFSRMAELNPAAEIVWPREGAIISPIFMLVRKTAPAAALRIADFFNSRQVGEILAHKGLFPSCHPEVENRVPDGARFLWFGWDQIRAHDLGELIPRLGAAFTQAGADRP